MGNERLRKADRKAIAPHGNKAIRIQKGISPRTQKRRAEGKLKVDEFSHTSK